MYYTKINSIEELKDKAKDGADFVINLGGGIRSSKYLQYIPEQKNKKFWLWNLVDDTTESLSESELLQHNIGIAMKHDNLYLETSEPICQTKEISCGLLRSV